MLRILALILLLAVAGAPARSDWLEDADRGLAAYGRGAYDEAIGHWTRVIESGELSERHLAVAFYNRALARYFKGNQARAAEDWSAAIRVDPRHAMAYNGRCWVRAHQDRLAEALADCDEGLRLRPDKADLYHSRGFVHEAMGARRQAERDYRKAYELNPHSPEHAATMRRLGLLE